MRLTKDREAVLMLVSLVSHLAWAEEFGGEVRTKNGVLALPDPEAPRKMCPLTALANTLIGRSYRCSEYDFAGRALGVPPDLAEDVVLGADTPMGPLSKLIRLVLGLRSER